MITFEGGIVFVKDFADLSRSKLDWKFLQRKLTPRRDPVCVDSDIDQERPLYI